MPSTCFLMHEMKRNIVHFLFHCFLTNDPWNSRLFLASDPHASAFVSPPVDSDFTTCIYHHYVGPKEHMMTMILQILLQKTWQRKQGKGDLIFEIMHLSISVNIISVGTSSA